ncbi:MAG: DUF3368 domain-containing protein [Lachnospiraceae bacterium]|nr:DUF3368 domain-containing protein [Lachnospiraceae bacterium]
MRRVIVNSTPLIILCGIGQLELLKRLYGEIHIPLAVYHEITAKEDAVCAQVKNAGDWIYVDTITDISEKKMYRAKLHDGEVEVMILAQEQKADLVIIDDNAAKKTAKYLELTVTGTLGVLLKAKKEGLVQEIRPILSEMKRAGFYVSGTVERYVLEAAGEQV